MKLSTYILTILIITSCEQSSSNKYTTKEISRDLYTVNAISNVDTNGLNQDQNLNNQTNINQGLGYEFEKVSQLKLTDTITVDFNGDRIIDQAIFKKDQENSGIIITHGGSNEEIKIGFGKPFAHMTDFNWVDYWGLLYDSKTSEIIIENNEIIGDREFKLDNPSIVLRKEEAGGGLITFKNGKYVWVHQSD